MPGPIDSLRFAHTAIERELIDLDRVVTAAASPAQAAEVADRFAFLEKFCDGHTRGEELGLFPELDTKLPKFSATYLFDHGDERTAFARIHEGLARCKAGDAAALAPLRAEVTKLADHVVRHIRKENELVIPLVHELFSVPEQASIVQRVVSVFTPPDLVAGGAFIIAWLDPPVRIVYGGILANVAPPPALKAMGERLKAKLSESDWSAFSSAHPGFA
jgi:hemerythrin-like domain-containing protein